MDRTLWDEPVDLNELSRDLILNDQSTYYRDMLDAYMDCKELYTSDVAGLRRSITRHRPDFDHKRTPTSTRYDLFGKSDYAEQFARLENGWDMKLFLLLLEELGFKARYKKPRITFPECFNWDKYPNLKRLYKVE